MAKSELQRVSTHLTREIMTLKRQIETQIGSSISFTSASEIYARTASKSPQPIKITIKKKRVEIKKV